MSYPGGLACTECGENFYFHSRNLSYYTGSNPAPSIITNGEEMDILLDPIWCFECEGPSCAEILPHPQDQ